MEYNDTKFSLNHYLANKLFENLNIVDGTLIVSDDDSLSALSLTETKKNCHLFAQTMKEYRCESSKITDIYIAIDFSRFNQFDELKKCPNGFNMLVNGQRKTYVLFGKSSSMSKHSICLYIDKSCEDKMNERVNFGYEKVDDLVLSKWYAYSGLALTDADIFEKDFLKFSYDQVVIVDDEEVECEIPLCVTGISVPLIIDKLTLYLSKDEITKNRVKREFDCFVDSSDLKNLKCKDLIKSAHDALNNNDVKEIERIIKEENKEIETQTVIEWEKIRVSNYPVDVNLNDGEGLIDLSVANEINKQIIDQRQSEIDDIADEYGYFPISDDEENSEYDDSDDEGSETVSYSYQIRLPFVKGVVHACNFQAFFKSKGVKKIKGLSFSNKEGKYHEYDVSKIRLILTKSQFKASSLFTSILEHDKTKQKDCLKEYFDNLIKFDYYLAISGKKPKCNKTIKLCYQFLSTIPFEENELNNLLLENKNNLEERTNIDEIVKVDLNDDIVEEFNFSNLYQKDEEFAKRFKFILDKRRYVFSDLKDKLKSGRLECNGARFLLCSDLLRLLYHVADIKMPEGLMLKEDEFSVVDDNFRDGSSYVILRNPHYSRNEIVTSKCLKPGGERQTYFGHLRGALMLNPTSFNAERLGGADFDGDMVVVLNNKDILKNVKAHLLNNNHYPVIKIPSLKVKRNSEPNKPLSNKEKYSKKVDCLQNTFSNYTGVISNIAYKKANEVYQEGEVNNTDDVAFFTILGGLEIDSAKSGKKPDLSPYQKDSKSQAEGFIFLKDAIKGSRKTSRDNFKKQEERYIKKDDKDPVHESYKYISNIELSPIETPAPLDLANKNITKEVARKIVVSFGAINMLRGLPYSNYNEDYKASKKMSKLNLLIKTEIQKIFNNNGYTKVDVNNFLNAFKQGDYYKRMKDYQKSPKKYHHMKDINERKEYLKKLDLNLNDHYVDILTNFKNKGYRLLFFALIYTVKNNPTYYLDFDFLKVKPLNYVSADIKALLKDDADDIAEEIKTKMIEFMKDRHYVSIKPRLILNDIYDYFKIPNDEKDFTIENLSAVFYIYSNDVMFSSYYQAIKNYVNREEE